MVEIGYYEKSEHFIANGLYYAIKAELLTQLNKKLEALKNAHLKSNNELEKTFK